MKRFLALLLCLLMLVALLPLSALAEELPEAEPSVSEPAPTAEHRHEAAEPAAEPAPAPEAEEPARGSADEPVSVPEPSAGESEAAGPDETPEYQDPEVPSPETSEQDPAEAAEPEAIPEEAEPETGAEADSEDPAEPEVSLKPLRDAALREGSAAFVCTVICEEDTVLAYQWQKRLPGAKDWADLPGETGSELRLTGIDDIAAYEGVQFRCRVTAGEAVLYTNAAGLFIPEAESEPEAEPEPEPEPEAAEDASDEESSAQLLGEESECQHTNKWYQYQDSEYRYTDTGNGTHAYQFRYRDCYYCNDCRKTVYGDWGEWQTSSERKHSWDDEGLHCTYCGAENTCTHANVRTQTERSSTYEPLDSTTHKITTVATLFFFCVDCGVTLREEKGDPYTETGSHWFSYDSGTCYDCGAENTCAHEHVTASVFTYTIGNYTDLGNGTHSYAYKEYTSYQCRDCGVSWKSEYGEPKTATQKHRFSDESSTCYYCGAENTCTHEHVSSHTYTTNPTNCTDLGNGTHSYTYREYTSYQCLDCGISWQSEYGEPKTATQKHSFSAELGMCTYCGAKNTCAHEHVLSDSWRAEEKNFTDLGNGTHSYLQREYTQQYCEDCGIYLSGEWGEWTLRTSPHYFSLENGQCAFCGAKNTCPHEHVTSGTYMSDTCNYTDLGDGTHSYLARDYTYYYCKVLRILIRSAEAYCV